MDNIKVYIDSTKENNFKRYISLTNLKYEHKYNYFEKTVKIYEIIEPREKDNKHIEYIQNNFECSSNTRYMVQQMEEGIQKISDKLAEEIDEEILESLKNHIRDNNI